VIKLLGLFALVSVAMSAATTVGAAALLATGGVAVCRIDTPDVDLLLPVPTRLADAGLVAARWAMPDEERAELHREIGAYLPMIEAVVDELAALPNGTVLVAVESPEETVRIERRGGRLHVDVRAPDASVHVSLPGRSLQRLVRQIAHL
jgi:hypothetical protein